MNDPQKVASCLVVARSNRAVLLQACEAVLDQMPILIEISVIDDHGLAFFLQRLD